MLIRVETDNAAFVGDDDLAIENYILAEQLQSIFNSIISKVKAGTVAGKELDINGNIVCSWEV